ncbi:MAG: hypothetical protein WCJ75_02315 [Desulfomonile sp.]
MAERRKMDIDPVEQNLRAIVLVNDPKQGVEMGDTLAQRGISARIEIDPEVVFSQCRSDPPHLVIVESRLTFMTGVRFLSELLKISWTTATILICDEEEEIVHGKTEGLGILGSVRTANDIVGLQRLLNTFFDVVSKDQHPIITQEPDASQPDRPFNSSAHRGEREHT